MTEDDNEASVTETYSQCWMQREEGMRLDSGPIVVAQGFLPWGMWDLPGSGIKPVSPALAGGFFTPEPWGEALQCLLFKTIFPS